MSGTVRKVPGQGRPSQALLLQFGNPGNPFVLLVASTTGVNAVCTQVHVLVAGIGDIRPVTARDTDMWIRVRNDCLRSQGRLILGRRTAIAIGQVSAIVCIKVLG